MKRDNANVENHNFFYITSLVEIVGLFRPWTQSRMSLTLFVCLHMIHHKVISLHIYCIAAC